MKNGSTINNKTGSIPQRFSLKQIAYDSPKEMCDVTNLFTFTNFSDIIPWPNSFMWRGAPTTQDPFLLEWLACTSWKTKSANQTHEGTMVEMSKSNWKCFSHLLCQMKGLSLKHSRWVPANREVRFRKIRILSILFKMTHFSRNIPDNDTVVQCNVGINGAPLQEAHLCHVGCHDTNLRDFKFSLEEGVLETRDPQQMRWFFLPSKTWTTWRTHQEHIVTQT